MRGVVSNLNSATEALLELRAFEQALSSFWQTLSLHGELMREIEDDVTLAEELQRDETATRAMIKDRVIRARASSSQIIDAFGELCRGVRMWGVAERGASNRPRSALETPPPPPRDGSSGPADNDD